MRFAILEHDYPYQHLDLLLQSGEVLKTWRLPADWQPEQSTQVEPLPDHRLLYLEFEGEISGGRGQVKRRDWGSLKWLCLEPGLVRVRLEGQWAKGIFEISDGQIQRITV